MSCLRLPELDQMYFGEGKLTDKLDRADLALLPNGGYDDDDDDDDGDCGDDDDGFAGGDDDDEDNQGSS